MYMLLLDLDVQSLLRTVQVSRFMQNAVLSKNELFLLKFQKKRVIETSDNDEECDSLSEDERLTR